MQQRGSKAIDRIGGKQDSESYRLDDNRDGSRDGEIGPLGKTEGQLSLIRCFVNKAFHLMVDFNELPEFRVVAATWPDCEVFLVLVALLTELRGNFFFR